MKVFALLSSAIALTVTTPPTWPTFRTDRISVSHPSGWFATARPLTLVTYPPQVLAIASYRFPTPSSPNGCMPEGTLAKMPPTGALIYVIEYAAPPLGNIRGREFPLRAKEFRLHGFAHYECFGPSYMLTFRDSGRFFQVNVAFGPRAGTAARATVLRIMNSFSAKPRS